MLTHTGLDLTLENGGAPVTGSNLTFDNTNVACFTRGTLIKTESGEVRIEDLAQGDLVLTVDKGLQPIRWIGSNYLSKHLLNEHENLRPIRIRAGALGDGLPTQDLLVSPQHRVLIRSDIVRRMFESDEVLVAAKHLFQVDGIEIAHDVKKVEYFHFLFDEHELVMSNGATTESLYTGPEALKSVSTNAKDEILTLFPELSDMDYAAAPCRTLVKGRLGRRMAMRHSKNNKQLVHCDEQIIQTS